MIKPRAGRNGVALVESDLEAYLSSWSNEFSAKADRVRSLIGGRHWLTDGHHKEALVRGFLKTFLPANYIVSRGFVRASSGQEPISNEQDVLVADPTRLPPLLNESGLLICGALAISGVLEVKSTFNASTCNKAFANLGALGDLIYGECPSSMIWSGALFYKLGCSRENIEGILVRALHDLINRQSPNSDKPASLGISCIAVLGSFVAFISPFKDRITYKIFFANTLALSLMIADLLAALPDSKRLIPKKDLMQLTQGLDNPEPIHGDVPFDEV